MTGVTGGTVTDRPLVEMVETMRHEDGYQNRRFEGSGHGLGVLSHGRRDPAGDATWQADGRFGAVHGVVSNLDDLGWSTDDLFERLLDRPCETLAAVDGCFVVAAVNPGEDRVVLGTDKLGTRPLYYADADGLAFGSEVKAPLATVEDPTVDVRGVSDLILIGHMWGQKTLVEEVSAVPPASVLVHDDGATEVGRYWEFDFGRRSPDGYARELVTNYQRLIAEMADGMDGRVGLWLSGGLDSRSMAAELRKHADEFVTYTYDANPSGGINLELAGEVADTLGVENVQVPLTADRFLDAFDRSVSVLDGTVSWLMYKNLTASFSIPGDPPDVLLEASGQGGLLGYDVWQPYLDRTDDPATALFNSDSLVSVDTVRGLLTVDRDPLESYREEARRSSQNGLEDVVVDSYYRNFYPRGDFASNKLAQSRTGTRVPFANGEFLDFISKMPREFRTPSFPLSGGKIPYGTAPLKLELVRAQNSGIESIPYERTRVPPSRPLWQHGVGFVLNEVAGRGRSLLSSGPRGMARRWYMQHEAFGAHVDGLLDDARDRPFFDADAVENIRRATRDGDSDAFRAVAGVTTFEAWAQQFLD